MKPQRVANITLNASIAVLPKDPMAVLRKFVKASGTREGALKGWDERGRGRHEQPSGVPADARQRKFDEDEIRAAAKKQGFTPEKIDISYEPKQFKVGERTFDYAGAAYRENGRITIWPDQVGGQTLDGLMAHEVMHQRWNAFNQELESERTATMELYKKYPATWEGTHNNTDNPMRWNGYVKDEFKDKYPAQWLYENTLDQNFEQMKKDDGVTEYSKAYWEQFGKTVPWQAAVHETLAEMARIKQDKVSYPEGMKPSKLWKQLFDGVMKLSKQGHL